MMTGAKPNSEPTERSNSPAVINSVIASAIRPSSTVNVSVLDMLSTDRKSGLIAVNTASSSTSNTRGPNSGAEIIARSREPPLASLVSSSFGVGAASTKGADPAGLARAAENAPSPFRAAARQDYFFDITLS